MKFDSAIVQCRFASPLGPMTLAATGTGLAGAWFHGQRHRPDTSGWPEAPNNPILTLARHQLEGYFGGSRHSFELPLDWRGGTPFQQLVWQTLLTIPMGNTTSYGRLSQDIGKPKAARAVGAAVGRNPISLIVPCHRVLGANGAMTGYAGGLDRKIALLKLERAIR
jgi:methylated-DNA-[protein]-cysteine S-methyltransferase